MQQNFENVSRLLAIVRVQEIYTVLSLIQGSLIRRSERKIGLCFRFK